MRFFLNILFSLFLGTVIRASVSQAAELGPELVPDPSFTSIGNLPKSFSIQKEGGRRILCKQRVDPGEYTTFAIPLGKLEHNEFYQLSIQVKAKHLKSTPVEVCNVEIYDKGKFREAKILRATQSNAGWQELSMEFWVGDFSFDMAYVVFFLERGATGSVYFRAPSVRKILPEFEQLEWENATLDPSVLPDAIRPRLEAMRQKYLARIRSTENVDAAQKIEQHRFTQWEALRQLWKTAQEFEKVRPNCTVSPGFEDVILGHATAAEKVLPRAANFGALPAEVKLSAAKNERESFQLIVFPAQNTLKQVQVTVSDLKNDSGVVWRNAFRCMPVGYVKTESTGCTNYIGYHPDPLMMHLVAVKEIAPGDAQSFWLRVAVPREQDPGIYRGTVSVTMNGKTAFRFPVTVRVYDFTLPNRAMLPLAISLWGKKKHMEKWTDMLTEYYITPHSLYHLQFRREPSHSFSPDFELLSKMKREGTLNLFNLGYVDEALDDAKDKHGMQFQIDRIRPAYEKAKELGLLEHAYIYGCDESHKLANVEQTAQIIKKEFPEVPMLTTAIDYGYGITGVLHTWDWYCPLIPNYEGTLTVIEKARRAGKQVWWYICCAPINPYPNIFVESPQMEIRLLMGAMSTKYRPDGFLYWEVANSENPKKKRGAPAPLGNEVFTTWNPNSYGEFNGDGSWLYRGADDIPLPSIRLEGFRDGLEDYAYSEILRSKVEVVRKAGKGESAWLREAESALHVPTTLVESLTVHASDPAELYRWRNRLAELIEAMPD